MVADVLKEASLDAAQVEAVIATTGPGSFMGARVGVSFGAGFALPHDIPTKGITTLDALWLSAPEHAKGAVVIDARRDQVYGHLFDGTDQSPFLLDIEEARERLSRIEAGQEAMLMGSGVSVLWPERQPFGPLYPDMDLLLRHMQNLPEVPLRPFYLRPPDAAPRKPRKALA